MAEPATLTGPTGPVSEGMKEAGEGRGEAGAEPNDLALSEPLARQALMYSQSPALCSPASGPSPPFASTPPTLPCHALAPAPDLHRLPPVSFP